MISKRHENLVDKMRVASPCSMSWDAMKGDDKKRFCQHCNLHVYNISAMTRRETEDLIKINEGRLCARVYRRADGTVLTQDCPIGLKALRRRLKMRVGVFLSALFGLTLTAFGQETKSSDVPKTQIKITRTVDAANPQNEFAIIKGTVLDENDALITNAKVTLTNEKTNKRLVTRTGNINNAGVFEFLNLEAGNYSLQIEANGFEKYIEKNFNIKSGEMIRLSVKLGVEEMLGVVGEIPVELGVTEQELNNTVMMRQITELPVANKDALKLLAPPNQSEKKDLPKKP